LCMHPGIFEQPHKKDFFRKLLKESETLPFQTR